MASDTHVLASLRAYLRPGMHALDIGAYEGRFATVMGQGVGPTGRVLAVEPDPVMAQTLRTHPAWRVVEAACGPVLAERVEFWTNPHNRRVNSLSRAAVVGGTPERVLVSMRTVDDLVQQQLDGRVDAIKIDTQGGEDGVLAGAEETLAAPGLRWLVLEVWPAGLRHMGVTWDTIQARLERHGFVPEGHAWPAVRVMVDRIGITGTYLDLVCVKRS